MYEVSGIKRRPALGHKILKMKHLWNYAVFIMVLTFQRLYACTVPSLEENVSSSCSTGTSVSSNDLCSFSCPTGYNLIGASTVTCTSSGSFTEPFPQCEACNPILRPDCPPITVNTCTVPSLEENVSSLCSPGTSVSYNDLCSFSCPTGYNLIGASSVACTISGSFSQAFPIDAELRGRNSDYERLRREGAISQPRVHILKPGTFEDLKQHVVNTTNTTANQYKVPQRLRTVDTLNFMFDHALPSASEESISVHTQYPELIYGASHVILAPTHTLLKKPEFIQNLTEEIRTKLEQLESERTDVDLGVQVLHPFTQQPVPLFASSRKTFEENVESHLGIPCSGEEEDVEFVHQHGISYEKVLDGGRIVNSDQLSRLSRDEARSSIMEHARELGIGGHMTSPRQFDWLISRQRYWGTPIPVIHCPTCKAVPVPHTELPVTLPKLDSLSGKGLSPLENQADWINTRCPKCGGAAKRETDTMDTFVDSSWYYLRYTDSTNQKEAFGKENADWLLPVDVYVGGKEHAIMHLLYARFINHFLHDQGLVAHKEPFKRLLVQGLVMGQSYRVTSTGKYITPDQVDHSGTAPVQKGTGEELAVKWEKMSKSKYNGVDPEGAIEEFGVDTVRLFILSGIPPDLDMMWNVEAISGVVRWKYRMWGLVTRFHELRSDNERNDTSLDKEQHVKLERELEVQLNKAIEDVTTHFGSDYMLSVAISRLMTLTNQMRAYPDDFIKNSVAFQDALGSLCIMVAPMAPLIASEMWQGIGGAGDAKDSRWDWTKTVLEQSWPSVTECNPVSLDTVELIIKINNKTSGKVSVPASLLEHKEELERFLLDSELGRIELASKTINKVIVAAKVPLVNFLTR
eukprot:XP_011678728.1 PREDICTED: probable leucine--tRNA ligase, mitochondrial [Strongylocentrotus purpuratus]